jgi:hypothetical protein
MSDWFDPGTGNFLMVEGAIVERDALYIAEKLQDYDPDLVVLCLDPENLHAQFTDAPFVVCRRLPNGQYQRVLEAWKLDDTVLERVYLADSHRHNQLDLLVKMEEKKKADKAKADKEKLDDKHQLFAAALRNKKSTFSFENSKGELVTIDETTGVKKDTRKTFS